jgi:hypothetical protein
VVFLRNCSVGVAGGEKRYCSRFTEQEERDSHPTSRGFVCLVNSLHSSRSNFAVMMRADLSNCRVPLCDPKVEASKGLKTIYGASLLDSAKEQNSTPVPALPKFKVGHTLRNDHVRVPVLIFD